MGVRLVKILVVIVLTLGLVLIPGYHKLTFGFLRAKNGSVAVTAAVVAEEFNFKRGGATPKPPLTEKSLFDEDEEEEPFFNRTAEAQNQDLVFFNRVPKTGSEMFQEFTKVLGNILGFHTYIDPGPMTFFPGSDYEKKFGQDFNQTIVGPGVYFRHIPYFNFSQQKMPSPIYLSMVRHPIERVVSWFYYVRWRNRPDERPDPEICKKSPEWKNFCDQFATMRLQELLRPAAWFEMDFNDCVISQHPDCDFKQGQGGWNDWAERKDPETGKVTYVQNSSLYADYRNQMMFFCGNSPDCISFNSATALSIAKETVEKHYSVVGVLEHLDKSLETIEAMVPKFYRNAQDIHKKNKANKAVTHTNKNPNKKKVEDKVRKLLEDRFDKELDFYNFCVQRLQKQWKNVRSISKYNDDSEWPAQLTDDDVRDEKFVMLASK